MTSETTGLAGPAATAWTAPRPVGPGAAVHRAGWYLALGLRRARPDWKLYLALVGVYSLPAAVSAALVWTGRTAVPGLALLAAGLPWITLTVAPAIVMVAVAASASGERIGFWRANRRGWQKLPRYLLTNVHTSLIFWAPVASLGLLTHAWPDPLGAAATTTLAIHQHVRTTLAPYAAVHYCVHPTRAAIASWWLGGRHFWLIAALLLAGSAPIGLPLLGGYAVLLAVVGEEARHQLGLIAGQLAAVLLQAIRPVLIPAVHAFFEDHWPPPRR